MLWIPQYLLIAIDHSLICVKSFILQKKKAGRNPRVIRQVQDTGNLVPTIKKEDRQDEVSDAPLLHTLTKKQTTSDGGLTEIHF